MIRVPRTRSPFHAARSFGWLAALLAAGCGPKPAFVLDSDIPAPQDASGRATSGIERRGAELIGVETVFADEIVDPQAALATLRGRFVAGGWTVETIGATGSTATAIFVKDDRRCRVRVVRNDLDPAMSRIAYRLDTVADEVDPSNG
jgi:hypothetical protein